MYKVLLVDDEPFIVEGMVRIIPWERSHFQISGTAGSAEEALAQCEVECPDLVITDIRMPGDDGLSLVEELKRRIPHIRCVVLSGHDDFSYVKRAMQLGIDNYLLKPVNKVELQQTLETVVARIETSVPPDPKGRSDTVLLRENVLWRWARGRIGEDELQDRAGVLGLNLRAPVYRVALVGFVPGNLEALRSAWDVVGVWAAADPTGRLLAVLAGDPRALARQAADLETLVAEVPGLCLALGAPVAQPMALHRSLTDAEDLLRYRLVCPGTTVLDSEGPVRLRTGAQAVPGFEGGKTDPQSVRSWLDRLVSDPQILPEQVQRAAAKMLLDLEGPGGDNAPLLDRLFQAPTTEDLAAVVDEALARDRRSRRGLPFSSLVQAVLDWIHGHTAEELSLKTLAARFQVNPTYLGQKFRQEVGVHFSPYLTELRIRKAKSLLETTHLRAGEVGSLVGFADPGYFFRIFREQTGQSPTEYRRARVG